MAEAVEVETHKTKQPKQDESAAVERGMKMKEMQKTKKVQLIKTEEAPSDAEQNSEAPEKEASGDQEAVEETEIKLETAPADIRFPTTNQTRHCFTCYIEYHWCIAARGEGAPECQKYAEYHRSICPGEWIERRNEQRENGTFPGPL